MNTRNADNIVTSDGSISVEISPAAGNLKYIISQTPTPVAIAIQDIDIPEISIAAPNRPPYGQKPTTERGLHRPGSDLVFKLSSNIRVAQDLTIRYVPSSTVTNLLNTATGLPGREHKQVVNFNNVGAGNLRVPTVNTGTRAGIITVRLRDGDDSPKPPYTASASDNCLRKSFGCLYCGRNGWFKY